jgi:hypothetical protein
MKAIVPASLLFQYFPSVKRNDLVPFRKGAPLQLAADARIFVPSVLNADPSSPGLPSTPAFDLRIVWNSRGLGVSIEVSGRRHPVLGDSKILKDSDHVQLMVDTRHTANVHRATSYCSAFVIVPVDSRSKGKPHLESREIAQQRDLRPPFDANLCRVWFEQQQDGYRLEVWLPAEVLFGFPEAAEIGRLGFCCIVHDTELGMLPLSVGDDFPVAFDPSQWVQMELSP